MSGYPNPEEELELFEARVQAVPRGVDGMPMAGGKDVPAYEEAMWRWQAKTGQIALTPEVEDEVNRPAHYNQGDIECLDAMVAAFGLEAVQTHAKCCAFKYLWRAGEKHSEPSQDLGKAVFYTRFANGDDPRKDRQ